MQTFLHDQKEYLFKENRLCHLEQFSKSPEAQKEDPRRNKETAEKFDPFKLTAITAEKELRSQEGSQELDLRKYREADAIGLFTIAQEFTGKSILLDNLTKITDEEADALARFKGAKISLRKLKLNLSEDEKALAKLGLFSGEIVNRCIVEVERGEEEDDDVYTDKAFFNHSTGRYFRMSYPARQIYTPDKNKKLEEMNYDFNGVGFSAEKESKEKFSEEVAFIANK